MSSFVSREISWGLISWLNFPPLNYSLILVQTAIIFQVEYKYKSLFKWSSLKFNCQLPFKPLNVILDYRLDWGELSTLIFSCNRVIIFHENNNFYYTWKFILKCLKDNYWPQVNFSPWLSIEVPVQSQARERPCICVFAYSGVQHILCCVFVLFVFVLCALCCQFLYIVHLWFPLRYSLTFI